MATNRLRRPCNTVDIVYEIPMDTIEKGLISQSRFNRFIVSSLARLFEMTQSKQKCNDDTESLNLLARFDTIFTPISASLLCHCHAPRFLARHTEIRVCISLRSPASIRLCAGAFPRYSLQNGSLDRETNERPRTIMTRTTGGERKEG